MGATTVTSKGQVTIPADIREAFGIRAGDQLMFFESLDGELKVHVSRPRVGAGRGSITAKEVDLSRAAIGQAVADGVSRRLELSRKPAKKAGSAA